MTEQRPSSFQVIRFVELSFEGQWLQHLDPAHPVFIGYTPQQEAGHLLVCFEAPTGQLLTQTYTIQRGHLVWVVNDVVHIPALCQRQEKGNGIHCHGG